MRMERMRDMRSRRIGMRDGRNPYGSRGGYVVSSRRGRDYGRMGDYGRVSEYSSKHSDMSHSRPIDERDWDYGERDYEWNRDYRGDVRRVGNFEYDTYYGDGRDYGYDDRLTSRELKEWSRDLLDEIKPEHRAMFDKSAFEKRAREMGLEGKEYSMEELYVTTLMMESDYGQTMSKYGINNLDVMIFMAKDFLEDPDSDLRFGDKLAAYYMNVACVY